MSFLVHFESRFVILVVCSRFVGKAGYVDIFDLLRDDYAFNASNLIVHHVK